MSRFDEKTTGLINSLDLKKPSVKMLYWMSFFILIVVSAVSIVPPLWILLSSMKDIREYFQIPPTIIPKSFHPEKLVDTWKLLSFWKYYVNSLGICAGSVVFNIIFNGSLGYAFSRLKPKGSSVIFMMVLWTVLIPNTVYMVPLFKNFIALPLIHVNITNSFWPLWLMAGSNAFYVLVFKSYFDGIPIALIEAARLDGCSNLSIFYRIMIPLCKPVLIVTTIFTINGAWGDFFWTLLVLKSPDKYSVIVKIYTMSLAASGISQDIIVVALIFALIPPVILFAFFQKYIMQGFTLSGIKG